MDKTFRLPNGIKIGDTVHNEVILREVTAGDVIEATESAEQAYVVHIGSQVDIHVAASPTRAGMLLLMKRMTKLGDLKMPISEAEFKKLSAADMSMLDKMATELDQEVSLKLAEKVTSRGRNDSAV